MKQGILFDLDGTLWDSSTEVAISWEEALRKRPDVQKEITGEMIRNVMGKSMYDIADILFGEYDLQTRRSLLDYCCEEENEYIRLHGGRLFEGLLEALQALREAGFSLYIVSNCQIGYIEAFLEHHSLGQYFDDFECFGRQSRAKATISAWSWNGTIWIRPCTWETPRAITRPPQKPGCHLSMQGWAMAQWMLKCPLSRRCPSCPRQ